MMSLYILSSSLYNLSNLLGPVWGKGAKYTLEVIYLKKHCPDILLNDLPFKIADKTQYELKHRKVDGGRVTG